MTALDWFRTRPEIRAVRVAAADLNGVARGKRVPLRFAEKLLTEGTRFPYSVLNLDIWGEDVEDSPLVFNPATPTGCCYQPSGAFCRCLGWMHRQRCCPCGCSTPTAAPMTAIPGRR